MHQIVYQILIKVLSRTGSGPGFAAARKTSESASNSRNQDELRMKQLIFCEMEPRDKKNKYIINLVGGWATPLKNIKVSWDDYSQYMQK